VSAIIPIPRCSVSVREATMNDLPFIDRLQKANTYRVGFLPGKQLEDHVAKHAVLIAEDESNHALGYCIAKDRYLRRDDLGVIYQLNVTPMRQRHLIGATLIKAAFDRAAYGCRLFCCWCAQDLAANHFWEAMGFVPLAFRTGCRKRQRIHIFWQRRIRQNDTSTPYWFPSQTHSGAYREDRLVVPIPPGTHWSDAKPVILPGMERGMSGSPMLLEEKATHGRARVREASTSRATVKKSPPANITLGRLQFAPAVVDKPKPQKPKREKVKADPAHVAAARELRDRWLEQVNSDPMALPNAQRKYEVSRALPNQPNQRADDAAIRALPAPLAA
jgi:N-acetylglutamate synthase-like GNAT family acetyltransferase